MKGMRPSRKDKIMSKRSPETLNLVMDYAALMEACAAYVAVKRPAIRDPESAYRLLRPLMDAATSGDSQETFFTLLLDTKNKVIGSPVECCRGLLDQCPVHPREAFREAVRQNAASLILAHNHPSGDPTPTKEDIDITRRLVEAGRILGIRIVDHVICGRPSDTTTPGYVSLRQKELVNFD
jgi:DNA repair protein RadC